MSAIGELTAFLRRYIVDDSELELSTFSGTLRKSTGCLALYRPFSLSVYIPVDLISNNLVTLSDTNKLLAWIVANNYTWMITGILELSSTVYNQRKVRDSVFTYG
jgi:hypothetical protein